MDKVGRDDKRGLQIPFEFESIIKIFIVEMSKYEA
jgi:hypothetical protein